MRSYFLFMIWGIFLVPFCQTPMERFAELVAESASVGNTSARICKNGETAGSLLATNMMHCCENLVFREDSTRHLVATRKSTLGGEFLSFLELSENTNMSIKIDLVKYEAFHKFREGHCEKCTKNCTGVNKKLIGEQYQLFGSVEFSEDIRGKIDLTNSLIRELGLKPIDVKVSGEKTTVLKSTGQMLSLCIERDHVDCSKTIDAPPIGDWTPVTQLVLPKDEDNPLVYTARGTGRTTGHVITLTVINPTDQILVTVLDDAFISPADYQSYVTDATQPIRLEPGDTVVYAVNGYCTRIDLEPLPDGTPAPPPQEWVYASELTDLTVTPIAVDAPGVQVISKPMDPAIQTIVSIPGTTRALTCTIDPAVNPVLFASVVIPAKNYIISTLDSLYEEEAIQTPFSFQPKEESDAIAQHSIWRITGHLTGGEYKIEDFERNLVTQYEDQSGKPIRKAPVEVREELSHGATVFWNTFSMVGKEAKVLRSAPGYWSCFKKTDCRTGSYLGRASSMADARKMGARSVRQKPEGGCESL